MSATQDKISAKRVAMINKMDALSDVTFAVGAEKCEIKAHKIFLITASDVFEAMFSNKFETDAIIVVEDIEEEAFLQVDI
jgi:BTB/POZ domain